MPPLIIKIITLVIEIVHLVPLLSGPIIIKELNILDRNNKIICRSTIIRTTYHTYIKIKEMYNF